MSRKPKPLGIIFLTFISRYIPGGTSKFGSFTIENIAGESTLHYRLFIDGRETWGTTVTAPSVNEKAESGQIRIPSSIWDRLWFT